MIGDPIALQIREKIKRPSKQLIKRFKCYPTTYIADAQNGAGCLIPAIKPLDDAMKVCGPAITTFCGPQDNLGAMAILDFAKEGDVIVISSGGDYHSAKIGDLWLEMAKKIGVAGGGCDGLVRDKKGLLDVGIPVFTTGITPNSGFKNGPGTINTLITCGNIDVAPGDIISGDLDGVVRTSLPEIKDIENKLTMVGENEKAAARRLKKGLPLSFWTPSKFKNRVKRLQS